MNINDWRIRGQEDYLIGVHLIHKKFKSNLPKVPMSNDDLRKYSDHDHCDFCWHKFMEECENVKDCSSEGYCTLDEKIWICDDCFNDFKEHFKWSLVNKLGE